MSYTSESTLAAGTRLRAVRELVELLNYRKQRAFNSQELRRVENYYFYEERDYKSWSGVDLSIYVQNSFIVVETRSSIGRSFYDLEHQNATISSLKERFGGSFVTDEGKGRYLRPLSPPPPSSASGCHRAFSRFGHNLIKASMYLESRRFPKQRWEDYLRPAGLSPSNLSNNLVIPFLVAALEDYFKSAFVALLRYSDRKASIFKNIRLQGEQLAAVSDGKSIEEQVVEVLPFQRISAVARNFELLDAKVDIAGALRKPYRRRKQSLFDMIEDMVIARHNFIHRAQLDTSLTDSRMHDLIDDLDVAITRVDRRLTDHFKWPQLERSWYLGNRAKRKQFRKERALAEQERVPQVPT